MPEAVWLIVLAGVAVNLKIGGIKGFTPHLFSMGKGAGWRIILFEELLFFAALAFWAFIRGFQPNIIGLEKFMDFGFVNSILRSKFFPPKDMWFAGETINYYYFGHLMTAVLTKLSGLASSITYNLMISTIFALTFTGAFSLGGNLIYGDRKSQIVNRKSSKVLAGGLLSAFLLTLSGNLHTLWWFLKHKVFTGYWYPDATRFIVEKFGALDNTIHEFPLYSWVVADLHGHMINVPVVLLILALLLNLKTDYGKQKTDLEDRKPKGDAIRLPSSVFDPVFRLRPSVFIFLALCFATTFMTNIWDIPIYFLVMGLVVYRFLARPVATLHVCFGVLLFSCLLSLPFHLNFENIAKGVALTDFHSPPWMLLVLWGFPLFVTVAATPWVARKEGAPGARNYITTLLVVSWLLILIPEIIYVKDIYINSYQRANTVFKLTYQSFIMFSLAGGYIVIKTLSNLKKNFFHFAYAVALFVLLIFAFIYPFYAVRSYYGLRNYQGLEGLKWLEQQYPDDYEAINWLKENIKGQPVILEAVGESYTDFGRVSSNTGLPTVVGWTVHEWLWRGSYDGPGARDAEVRKIYESADAKNAKELLTKYKIEYVFVGNLERQKYAGLLEEKFAKMGKVVFENEGTKIYHLSKDLN